MLPPRFRLTKKDDFSRVLKYGRIKSEGQLALRFCDNNLRVSRFAFLASKKLFPRAVQRNLIKRQFREALRQQLDIIKPGSDIILVIKGDAGKDFFQRKESLVSLLRKRT